jgi:hypothetical protein
MAGGTTGTSGYNAEALEAHGHLPAPAGARTRVRWEQAALLIDPGPGSQRGLARRLCSRTASRVAPAGRRRSGSPPAAARLPACAGAVRPSIQRTLPIPASNSDNTRLYVMEGTRPALFDRHEARGAVGLARPRPGNGRNPRAARIGSAPRRRPGSWEQNGAPSALGPSTRRPRPAGKG